MADERISSFVSRNTLCRTLAGNKCEYLTITSREKHKPDDPNRIPKKGVVITARVHPGESVGSWMMKGVIDFLTSDWDEAKALRKLFIFKVIPMLNPDGVINGNYRWSLSGGDLNRRWKAPSRVIHPTVYEAKKLWIEFQKEREVTLFCDLHGHSRRKNIFMYGNTMSDDQGATRLFPFIMSKLVDYFSFDYSRFSVTKSKETTARISLFRELNIPWIYTMEASFWGANQGELDNLHFNAEHFNHIGQQLFHALIMYWKIDVQEVLTGKKSINELPEGEGDEADSIMNEFKENADELIKTSEAGSSDGSDSEPSEDNMSDGEIAKILPVKPKKKKPKKLVTQNSLKKRKKELEQKLKEKNDRRKEAERAKKSPLKRVYNYKNALKDRFNLSRIKKVEMVDAWTQTSNNGTDTETEEKKKELPKPPEIKHSQSIRETPPTTLDHKKLADSPISMYKKTDSSQNRFQVKVNSTISNNKTFRSPISNSITNDYRKKEYNTSFSMSKSSKRRHLPGPDLNQSEGLIKNSKFSDSLDMKRYRAAHRRDNSSRHETLESSINYKYPQTQMRKSPTKLAHHPSSASNPTSLASKGAADRHPNSMNERYDGNYNTHAMPSYSDSVDKDAPGLVSSSLERRFSTQYTNKIRKYGLEMRTAQKCGCTGYCDCKSNQYLPDLKLNNQSMASTGGMRGNSLTSKLLPMPGSNMHIRSNSKDFHSKHNRSKFHHYFK